ncbi:MAG: hypothetical protein LBT51_08650 [Fusobacteriaceae bacterium]|nr:hypothetical protein [Fusobacteriaceae bacterium]
MNNNIKNNKENSYFKKRIFLFILALIVFILASINLSKIIPQEKLDKITNIFSNLNLNKTNKDEKIKNEKDVIKNEDINEDISKEDIDKEKTNKEETSKEETNKEETNKENINKENETASDLKNDIVVDNIDNKNIAEYKKFDIDATEKTIEEIVINPGNPTVAPVPTNDIYFTKISGIKVFTNPENTKKEADTLIAGVRVKLLEKKAVITKSVKKIKDKTGKTVDQTTETSTNWEKISYRKNNKKIEGWIKSNNLVNTLLELLNDSWKELDFNEIEKKEYTDNKKIPVRGIYVSGSSAGLSSKMDQLIDLTKRTDINTFVIDVKDDSGNLLFKMEEVEKYSKNANKYNQIKDMESFMKKLKDNNIYTIARIVSFKDPQYAATNPDKTILDKTTKKSYTDKDKVIWISPYDRNLWEYNIAVAKEAARVGFNEVQFDYVRFPASNDGKLDKNLDYRNTNNEPKPVAIQKYLKYARTELEPLGIYISADVFGQIGSVPNDMDLGQHWEAVSNVVDYISPMIYPSHYSSGVYGIAIPDTEPYNLLYRCTRDEINRNENIDSPAGIRPWIQAFTATWVKDHIPYGYEEIQQQIKALSDIGIKEYLLWNASNHYTNLEKNPPKEESKKEELKKEESKKEEPKKEEPKKEEPKKEIKKVDSKDTKIDLLNSNKIETKPETRPSTIKKVEKPIEKPVETPVKKPDEPPKKEEKLIDRFRNVIKS